MPMQNSRWWNGIVGGVSGLALVSAVCQFWLNAGTSLPAQTALAVTLLLTIVLNAVIPTRCRVGLVPQGIRLFVLSAWPVVLPSLCDAAWRLIGAIGFDLSASVLGQCAGLTLLALPTLGVPGLCALGLNSSERSASFGISFAVASALGGVLLANFIGPDGCGLLASASGLIAFVTLLVRGSRNVEHVSSLPAQARSSLIGQVENLPHVAALISVGVLWVIGQRVCRQLIPDSFALMTFEWSVLVAGIAIGGWLSSGDRWRNVIACGIGLSCWTWLCLAAFPLGVRLALWENSTISQVWLLQSLRLALAGVVLGPIALSCGALLGRFGSAVNIAGTIGSALVTMWLLPSLGVWNFALFASSLLLLVAVTALQRTGFMLRAGANETSGSFNRDPLGSVSAGRRAPQRVAVKRLNYGRLKYPLTGAISAIVLFALSAPTWVRYRPELAAKVLFDTGVFVASRAETPWEQLPVLDEGRAAIVVEGDRGTLTAWKFAGSRYLVRENGIPKGTLATNANLAPRFLPDVLPTLLPLVAHERPQSVLLLGARAGEPVAAATVFPLQRIVCVEADRGVVELCRRLPLISEPPPQRGKRSRPEATSFDDDRLVIRVCDPAFAVRTMRETFDVVVVSADQPSLSQSANTFTVESLRAAAERLNDDGLFAIRFQHVDFGPRSVRALAATMSAVFREVAAVEMAPGELLFLGTQSERGFAREGFIERWRRPQVRQLLALAGWDWCAPLRLPMLNHEAMQELAGKSGGVTNVASRSTWPFRLPTEVMRWENKLQLVQNELAKHSRFLLAWGGDEADNADVAARLSEWELSRAIIRRHQDEFWAYRKQVKDHMTGSPRAMIQQVSHSKTESGLHPDDDRRLRYFRTIGELAKNSQLAEADLDRLRRFESPFDPLVTPFLYQEVVELTGRCADRDPANELRHRLAAIYFSTSADRSIRNVADALQFVNSTPAAIASQTERFDHLNALLQMLLSRWSARGEFRPTSSRVALNDIERSIAAAETSFATLDTLAAEGVVPVSEWEARKQHLERRLVRPLRTYRGQVLQHYVKNERTKEAAANLPVGDAVGDRESLQPDR
jgi:uncharacterized membrane protein YuzA (DUF378 family)